MDLAPLAGNATAASHGGEGLLLRGSAILVLALLTAAALWAMRRSPRVAHDEMTALEHVEELRRRILAGLTVWLVGSAVAFSFRYDHLPSGLPVLVPSLDDNLAAQMFTLIADHLVPPSVTLVVTRPLDAFMAEVYLALGIGFLAALPVLLVQVGRYIGPALHRDEVRMLRNALLPALVLFALGVAFAWIWVIPFILETLYGYADDLGAQPLLAVADLVAFTVGLLLTFGVAFQTPLLMHVLARTGLVRAKTFLRLWRHAVVAILIFSAIVTDPTIISQVLVAVPLILLYLLGAWAAKWGERKAQEAP